MQRRGQRLSPEQADRQQLPETALHFAFAANLFSTNPTQAPLTYG